MRKLSLPEKQVDTGRIGPTAPRTYASADYIPEREPHGVAIAWVDHVIRQEAKARGQWIEASQKKIEAEKKFVRDSGFLGTNYWHETHSSWAWRESPDRYPVRAKREGVAAVDHLTADSNARKVNNQA